MVHCSSGTISVIALMISCSYLIDFHDSCRSLATVAPWRQSGSAVICQAFQRIPYATSDHVPQLVIKQGSGFANELPSRPSKCA